MADKDINITDAEIIAVKGVFEYLKENKQVLDPTAWQHRAITWNYAITAIPVIWALLNAFGVKLQISSDQAVHILEVLLVTVPVAHNVVLAATHPHVTMNPFKNRKILTKQREIAREMQNAPK